MKERLRHTTALIALAIAATPVIAPAGFADDDDERDDDNAVILPYSGDIDPFAGDISPFSGDINPFSGDINPFYGDISPFWGDISPFWGDIDPFSGDINPFAGDISPFWGDISPFTGDIDPFAGDISPFTGDISPFWGDIQPFWGDIGPFWGDINAFWGDIDPFTETSSGDYSNLAGDLETMFARAEEVFGAAIQDQSGQSFRDGFLADLLASYGFDPSDPASLEGVSSADRSRFFLDFYDGLMNFTGIDRVDHWMPAINWSPSLSYEAGAGNGVTVGLLDFSLHSVEGMDVKNPQADRGWLDFNHGAAVASLIGAPIDGRGVMGVAPESTLFLFNPFDESLSTNWEDVAEGIEDLLKFSGGADIINLSLGVPDWTFHYGWAEVFADKKVRKKGDETLFVLAAGNDGVSQTTDVDWHKKADVSRLLIVGATTPDGNIASFSNRPGTACLTVRGECRDGYRLMDRFLVAPGTLMLTSDGEGGTTRLSGTSFAAPLVSGAAALVQGRWGWLTAEEVANVLLWSADDLGDPGVDEVYGWGMLNVDAALSPLDPNDLFVLDGSHGRRKLKDLGLRRGQLRFRSSDEAVVEMFEPLGETYRDFQVTLDDIMGYDSISETEREALMDVYLAERAATSSFTGDGRAFTDIRETARILSSSGDVTVRAFASRLDPREQVTHGDLPFQAGIEIRNTATGNEMRFGSGEGALAMNQQDGFALFSDHRPETGGVNPVLGFASGGAYAMSSFQATDTMRLSFGLTNTRDELVYTNPFTGEEAALYESLDAYQATAFMADVRQELGANASMHLSYTLLNEDTGFLGAQGTGPLAMNGGTMTDAVTVGADTFLGHGVSLSGSATFARTRANDFNGGMLDMPENTLSTAFQVSARRDGVFGNQDALRFSVIQPLHIEQGALTYTATSVIDRETGELGVTTQTWELGGERPLYTEVMYATPMMDGRADLSLFSRFELSETQGQSQSADLASGVRLTLKF